MKFGRGCRRSLLALLIGMATVAPAAGQDLIQVSTSSELTAAISSVPDGGVIELLSGIYYSPIDGFFILNPGRTFTIRAQSPGSAILDGQGSNLVVHLHADSPSAAGWVSFEGLVFQNGFSDTNVRAGGVTLVGARAGFVDCVFDSNHSAPVGSTGGTGGGAGIFDEAFATFNRCVWRDNTATNVAGGFLVGVNSEAYIHDSEFIRNRTNIPNHRTTANGGAIIVRAAKLQLTNTRFEENQTGFSGGAIKAASGWDDRQAELVVANCTFIDNIAEPHPAVTTPSPPAGGAIMVEAYATASIYNSRFISNSAELGGAVSSYRSDVNIYSSIFRGNEARANGSDKPRGGAIKVSSNDTSGDGDTNYPSAGLVVRDSFFQGRYQGVGAAGQSGGCIYAAGDTNRMYGLSGVSQGGTLAQNRSPVDIHGSVFVDCDVDEYVAGEAYGGAINGVLVDLTITDSLFADNDAFGSGGRGGAIAMASESAASFNGDFFVNNTASHQGGALRTSGSDLQVSGSFFIANEVSPGVSEPENESWGAAIFTTPLVPSEIDATGQVQTSTFISNVGMTIYDDDRVDSFNVVNDVRYNANLYHAATFADRVYRNKVAGSSGYTPIELNALIVDRGNGNTTDKSPQSNNLWSSTEPIAGRLMAVPTEIIDLVAVGDPATSTESFLAYGWSGDSATLNGASVSGNRGWESADVGPHELMVGATSFPVNIDAAELPDGSLTADPQYIDPFGESELEWDTLGGSFIDSVISWGVETNGDPSGTVTVMPVYTRTFGLNLVTEQGGVLAEVTVYVDGVGSSPMIFADGFESGDTSAWSATSP